MSKNSASIQPSPTSQNVSSEAIAMRAYEIWCQRGRVHGQDKQHWLEAEKQLRTEQPRKSPPSVMPGQRR